MEGKLRLSDLKAFLQVRYGPGKVFYPEEQDLLSRMLWSYFTMVNILLPLSEDQRVHLSVNLVGFLEVKPRKVQGLP